MDIHQPDNNSKKIVSDSIEELKREAKDAAVDPATIADADQTVIPADDSQSFSPSGRQLIEAETASRRPPVAQEIITLRTLDENVLRQLKDLHPLNLWRKAVVAQTESKIERIKTGLSPIDKAIYCYEHFQTLSSLLEKAEEQVRATLQIHSKAAISDNASVHEQARSAWLDAKSYCKKIEARVPIAEESFQQAYQALNDDQEQQWHLRMIATAAFEVDDAIDAAAEIYQELKELENGDRSVDNGDGIHMTAWNQVGELLDNSIDNLAAAIARFRDDQNLIEQIEKTRNRNHFFKDEEIQPYRPDFRKVLPTAAFAAQLRRELRLDFWKKAWLSTETER